MSKYDIFDFQYDRETKTMWVFKKILVSEFLYLKKKYGHVEVREKEIKRW
jgi:hypothetical protein